MEHNTTQNRPRPAWTYERGQDVAARWVLGQLVLTPYRMFAEAADELGAQGALTFLRGE